MTSECTSFTFDPRDMLLSVQICFGFVRAAVACSILERISGPSHHLKQLLQGTEACYVPSFCTFTLISLLMPFALFAICLVLSALAFFLYLVQVLSRLSGRASSSCYSSSRASMSSANCRVVKFLPPVLTFPLYPTRSSDMIC